MDSKEWPSGGLEKILKEIGAGSLTKAVEKVRAGAQMPLKPDTDPDLGDYLSKAMARISEITSDVDTDKIPVQIRDTLSKMPLETKEQINAWGKAWVEEVKKIKP